MNCENLYYPPIEEYMPIVNLLSVGAEVVIAYVASCENKITPTQGWRSASL
jgi:hypothetical protein